MGVLDQRKGALAMGKRRQTPEQIISKLREAEVELARGMKVPEVCKKLGIAEYTYYRWRKEYGGLRLDQARRLRELERENLRLKRLVADLSLDNAILREAAQGNF
jgi:transposase-like protein